ncbi:MAG: DUF1573 domain-containing protein [Spirochaetaceae bacterium]|jgi:cytochrome c biogenesis protein CcdA|nr:DUF1573 domain-containing protein [Spirochaetaceae bacterium]
MMFKRILFFILSLAALPLFGQIDFSQNSWDLGEISEGEVVVTSLELLNTSQQDIRISLTPDCSCLTVSLDNFTLSPGASQNIQLSYDSSGQSGDQKKHLIIRTSHEDLTKAFFPVEANIVELPENFNGQNDSSQDTLNSGIDGEPLAFLAGRESYPGEPLLLDYYYSPGCRSCEEFLVREIPLLEESLQRGLAFRTWNILQGDVMESVETQALERNLAWTQVPVIVGRHFLLQGEDEIKDHLHEALQWESSGRDYSIGRSEKRGFNLAILPVFFAGLLDGVNPCAFTTIIFLISALTVFGRRRREILLIGLAFTLAVFVSYYAVGLGLFSALRLFSGFTIVSQIISWLLLGGLVVLALFSFRDGWLCYKGRAKEMTLQLPEIIKKRMKTSIKDYARSSALVGGALLLGVTVSLFELACTGQVYLPILAWMAQQNEQPMAWAWLLLYNLGFILPLAGVFWAAWTGIKSQRIIELYQRRMAPVKVALGFFFLGMALLLLLGMGLI